MTTTETPATVATEPDGTPSPRYAQWWRRAVASVADGLLVAAVAWLATGSFAPVPFRPVPSLPLSGVPEIEPDGRFSWWTCGAVVVLLVLQSFTGMTPGKAMVGVRVVRERDGAPAGLPVTVVRDVLHVLDWILLVGWLRPLWHARRQTFADSVVRTVVVRARVDVPVPIVVGVATVTVGALVLAPSVTESGETAVSCTLPADHASGIATLSAREPGDVWVTRLGIRRLSPAQPPVVLSWTPAAGAPTDGTTLAVALVGRGDDVTWHATVDFHDGAAWTDDVTQVPELLIPRSVVDDAGDGAMLEVAAETGGSSETLCGMGFGSDGSEPPASPRVDR
ncbi:RDD family protein [Cellulomonas fimi]|uniref:RDD family protein n=1 Tax=Cellulomonas fimi TaxID=1708 RepID=UPI00234D2E56|nr:RDD family protein [Cellulomonas fimi]MDC7123146.1 RDD family protein [Cellulomonas fimi]